MSNTFDPKLLRNVAGAFATGVSVITTLREDGEIHGMTANSFLSVSLDPALVAFSIKENGSMMNHIDENKSVSISILTDRQIDISNHFAGQKKEGTKIKFVEHTDAVPTIDNCLAWYNTVVKQIIPAGDHYIILCEIKNLQRPESQEKPLLYFSGYKSIAQ